MSSPDDPSGPTLIELHGAYVVRDLVARMTGLPAEALDLLRGADADDHALAFRSAARPLFGALRDPRLCEGIATLNWPLLASLRRLGLRAQTKERLPAKDRWRAIRLALYVQRLAAKCDSNGAFGPVSWGHLDPGMADPVRVSGADEHFAIADRKISVPCWVLDRLIRTLVHPALPTALRVARLHPMCFWREGELQRVNLLLDPPRVESAGPIPADWWALLQELDGTRSLGEIAAATGIALDLLVARLDALSSDRWVLWAPELPVGVIDPLDWLHRWAEAHRAELIGDEVFRSLGRLQRHREAYRRASGEQRIGAMASASDEVQRTLATPATVGAGKFYADRYVLYEDAERAWDQVALGAPALRIIERDLTPMVRAFMGSSSHRWRLARAALAGWFARRFPGGRCSLPEYCAASLADPEVAERLRAVDERSRRVGEELRGVLLERVQQGRAHVDRAALERFSVRYPSVPAAVHIDVMLELADRCTMIVGEVHAPDALLSTQSPMRMHPDPDRLAASVAAAYRRTLGDRLVVAAAANVNQSSAALGLGFDEVEVFGRARDEGELRFAGRSLSVELQDGELSLRLPAGDVASFLRAPVWPPHHRTSALMAFAPPAIHRVATDVFFGALDGLALPRVVLGDLVAFRASWPLEVNELGPADGYREFDARLRDWRSQSGAPARVFAWLPFERKPVLVDLESPILKEWLRRRLIKHPVDFRLTEMHPDVGELWLGDSAGRYCVEFRLGLFLPSP